MAGTLGHFVYCNDEAAFLGTARHEAAHALRAHSFGVPIHAIKLNPSRGWPSHVKFAGDPNDYPPLTHAQISLAGPMASLRYLRDHPHIVFPERMIFGVQEDETDLLRRLGRARWLCDDVWFKFDQLTPEVFVDSHLTDSGFGLDDIERAFNDLMIAHYNRTYRIPRMSTLLRHYRMQEQIAHQWIEDHWPMIEALADYILAHEKPTTRYTHLLPGKKLYSWVHRAGL